MSQYTGTRAEKNPETDFAGEGKNTGLPSGSSLGARISFVKENHRLRRWFSCHEVSIPDGLAPRRRTALPLHLEPALPRPKGPRLEAGSVSLGKGAL